MLHEREIQNSPVPASDRAKIVAIRRAAVAESKRLRKAYPLLDRFQSQIGLSLLIGSAAAMAGVAALYIYGLISAWLAIPLIAIITSVAHEIEHDNIHRAYFPRSVKMQNIIFALVWAMRPGTVSPWVRKHLHLAHHNISGSHEDIEERSITNGEKWGLKRIIMLADGLLAVVLRLDWNRPKSARKMFVAALKSYAPLGLIHYAVWYAFLAYHFAVFAGLIAPAASSLLVKAMTALVVIFVAPHTLRSFAINLVSSNMHYFGDVEKGNVVKQTQIIDSWLMLPLHIFCFNFGKTHGIHHYWASDPFYLRQMSAARIIPVMIENGVRVNDFRSMTRANRFSDLAMSPEI